MTTWRHANEPGDHGLGQVLDFTCVACFDAGKTGADICTTPTPDPASPCGYPECEHDARATWTHPPAGPYLHGSHPYRPTRCTCGHPIEEASR